MMPCCRPCGNIIDMVQKLVGPQTSFGTSRGPAAITGWARRKAAC